jgi:hypothetical protein
LNNLKAICIEATDVNEGLEYLPFSLIEGISWYKKNSNSTYWAIECSPHGLEVGCKTIQDQLRPFNYDLEA